MARIELRNSKIRLIDGYTNTALVNDTLLTGETELDLDTLGTVERIPFGTKFTIAGSIRRYFVTDTSSNEKQLITVDATAGQFKLVFTGTMLAPISAQTTADIAESAVGATIQTELEALAAIAPGDVTVTGGAGGPWVATWAGAYAGTNMNLMTGINGTTPLSGGTATIKVEPNTITFTPALLTADGIPANNAAITFSGRTLEINVGDGNLTYNETKEFNYDLNRGNLDTVREGDQQPMEVSLDFIWDFLRAISGAGTPTIEEVFKKTGEAAGWTSSSADLCEPYAIDVEVEHTPPCGGAQREIITLPDFRYESLDHNISDAQVSVSGKCNAVQATVVRAA